MAAGLRIWLEAARPKTLAAAAVPVAVGTAIAAAHNAANSAKALICLVFALLVQIGTNYANDYFDFLRGADGPQRSGPRRAVSAGLVTPASMRRATIIILSMAFTVGLLLVPSGGWPLLAVGLVSIACAIAYTGGPYPLAYHGWGDVFVFVFFGLVAVSATTFVQIGHLSADSLSCGAAIGLLAANILVVNNYRDVEGDTLAGKRTLIVRYGRHFAVWQYALSHLVALLAPPALVLARYYRWEVLAPLLLAPWAAVLIIRLARSRSADEQISLLGQTAAYLAAYGALLCAGLILGH